MERKLFISGNKDVQEVLIDIERDYGIALEYSDLPFAQELIERARTAKKGGLEVLEGGGETTDPIGFEPEVIPGGFVEPQPAQEGSSAEIIDINSLRKTDSAS